MKPNWILYLFSVQFIGAFLIGTATVFSLKVDIFTHNYPYNGHKIEYFLTKIQLK
jgi:hypothetical protein